jgi:hypothetical protein
LGNPVPGPVLDAEPAQDVNGGASMSTLDGVYDRSLELLGLDLGEEG